MSNQSESIVAALRLIWDLLGRARVAVVAGAAAVLLLSALGVVHLFSHAKAPTQPTAAATPTATPIAATPAARDVPQKESGRLLAITDLKPTRKRLRDGSTQVIVTIGVAPQAEVKPADVDIRVFFYDVTRDGQLRPTNAQVAYAWLTAERDWSQPTPKLLQAVYRRPRRQRDQHERTRFGGFIVQVYSDGRLQDERGEPRQILAALRQKSTEPQAQEAPAAAEADEDDEGLASMDAQAAAPPLRSGAADTPVAQPAASSAGSASPGTPAPLPTSSVAAVASTAPMGKPAPGKPGFVYSPHDARFIIDVRGVPSGMEIIDPNTGKPLRVP